MQLLLEKGTCAFFESLNGGRTDVRPLLAPSFPLRSMVK